jgi:hypothetical protein
VILGVLYPLTTGPDHTAALGYIGQGGTLTTSGVLFVNRSTWAHVLQEVSRVLGISRDRLLTTEEMAALDGKMNPQGTIISEP